MKGGEKMKKILILLNVLVLCFLITGCSEKSSKPDDMSDETYEVGLKVLKIADKYLDGVIDKEEATRSINIITDDFFSGDEVGDAIISANIKRIEYSLNVSFSSVQDARDDLAENLGEK